MTDAAVKILPDGKKQEQSTEHPRNKGSDDRDAFEFILRDFIHL